MQYSWAGKDISEIISKLFPLKKMLNLNFVYLLMDDEACSFIHPYLSSVCQYLSSLDLKQLTELGKIFVFCNLCCI